MPSIVNQLFINILGREPAGVVKWGKQVPCDSPGIYVITLDSLLDAAPISFDIVKNWINYVPLLKLDREKPTTIQLTERLKRFWYPDEYILYIGQSKDSIKKREQISNSYYPHELYRNPNRVFTGKKIRFKQQVNLRPASILKPGQ